MIRHIVDCRLYLTLMLTVGIGLILNRHVPFPEDNAILLLVAAEKPKVFITIKYAYQTMLLSTPFIGASMLFSLLYIFFVRPPGIHGAHAFASLSARKCSRAAISRRRRIASSEAP